LPGNFLPASHLITLDVIEGKAKGWSTYYKINDGKWFNYQGGIHLQKEGSNVIQYYSEDRLGNREKMKTVEYILDSEAPLPCPSNQELKTSEIKWSTLLFKKIAAF
jgi:hypothetical protein